jgi:hypothetical protein
MSLALSNGSRYKIEILRTPTPDCIRLANNFYNFFEQLQWSVAHKPATPMGSQIEQGIHVTTVPDNIEGAPIKNIR